MALPHGNGNGRLTALVLFLAGLIATLASAYVLSVERNVNARVDSTDKRLDRIEEKIDRLLLRRSP